MSVQTRCAAALLACAACVRPESRGPARPDVEQVAQAAELQRAVTPELRGLLASADPAVRTRAALALGRIGDGLESLRPLLVEPVAGETAAWALGRVPGGAAVLIECLQRACPAGAAATRALAGPAAAREATSATVRVLAAAAMREPEAGFALGVLARSKDVPVGEAREALVVALPGAGAVYALSRLPKADIPPASLEPALRVKDAWTRSLAARAWGRHGLPAAGLAGSLRDLEWRVRVEAARGLATAPGAPSVFAAAVPAEKNPHVLVALFESAAQIGELVLPAIPDPASLPAVAAVRCAAAQARDRIRKQLADTPRCGTGLEPEWRSRLRAGTLAAELAQERPELLATARVALHDPDARVRGGTAASAGSALAPELRELLADPDPFVVQNAAGKLAKENPAASIDAALAAVERLKAAHDKPAGDPQSDALAALVELIAAAPPREQPALLQLLPAPSVVLHAALAKIGKLPDKAVPVLPPEARQQPGARVLRLRTAAGEMVIDLRPDVAPLTSSALAALAARHFYDGLTFHRVVPDFVVQGGDPRGDGDGGPGWALPDEHSPLRFARGTLGIATSGPETGSSQFFLCHSPQPHLDGRYTIAGELREGADVLDALQPGDTILSATAE